MRKNPVYRASLGHRVRGKLVTISTCIQYIIMSPMYGMLIHYYSYQHITSQLDQFLKRPTYFHFPASPSTSVNTSLIATGFGAGPVVPRNQKSA